MIHGSLIAQDISGKAERLWKPQTDEVYLQESVKKIVTEEEVLALLLMAAGVWLLLMTGSWSL